jgi:hypothetical protein
VKRLAGLLACVVVFAGCSSGDHLEGASSCADLSDDVSSLSDDEAQDMGNLVWPWCRARPGRDGSGLG